MLKKEVSVGAWKNDVLIGFARAVSDGKFRVYIEDVAINKEFQKLGTGTKLVSVLLEELSHIDVISLFCEYALIPPMLLSVLSLYVLKIPEHISCISSYTYSLIKVFHPK